MFYFIPAWYSENRSWRMETPYWYRVMNRLVFDDTTSQLKLFHDAGEKSRLVLLAYQPHLRYFLHKHDLLGINYWSFFDDIQNIHLESSTAIDFKELNWPEGASFTYSPFFVHVRVRGEIFAIVQFAENGNLHSIETYHLGVKEYQYIFDDRGFLSSHIVFQDGQAYYQNFLNLQGTWQVREYLEPNNKSILINPEADGSFLKTVYSDWEELIEERLKQFKNEHFSREDCLVIAAHDQHDDLLGQLFSEHKKIYSLFEERFLSDFSLEAVSRYAQLLLVQNEEQFIRLKKVIGEGDGPAISQISLFDTRLRLGKSQTVAEMRIYFVIDGITIQELKDTLERLWPLLAENKLLTLELVTYDATCNMTSLEEELLAYILTSQWASELTVPVEEGENQLLEEERRAFRSVYFSTMTDENQIIAALDIARVVVDLSQTPHHYTQIACLSAGLPQVNRVENPFVHHLQNGWIMTDEGELPEAIRYYTDGLSNWNKALVKTVQMMADYTSGRLIDQWKDMIKTL